MISYVPHTQSIGQRPNSGVYLQQRYEIQILDSFGVVMRAHDCGVLYGQITPAINMCYPPLAWQTYDIDFTAARYDAAGKKTKLARCTREIQRRDDSRRRRDPALDAAAGSPKARRRRESTSRPTGCRCSSGTSGSWRNRSDASAAAGVKWPARGAKSENLKIRDAAGSLGRASRSGGRSAS